MAATKPSVVVVPSSVVFEDADVGCIHRQTFSVRNCSPIGKEIRFRGPATQIFQMSENKRLKPSKAVAPGLSVSAVVEYYPTSEEEAHDRIVIFVDDREAVEVPLVGFPPRPRLVVGGPVNFGLVVADGRVLTDEFVIQNEGMRPGGFDVTYGGHQPVKIIPSVGMVDPGQTVTVKVELIAENPGEHVEELSVSMEGGPLTMIQLFAQIVNRSLLLLAPDGRSVLKCVNFGPMYYGAVTEQEGLLVNSSPYPTSFVSILEEGGIGEEPGVDLTCSTTTAMLAAMNQSQRKEYGDSGPSRHTVSMLPRQGTIGPYQKMPVTFTFTPHFLKSTQGWRHDDEAEGRRDYALFMHIEPVGIGTDTSVLAGQSPSVEVALTGTALPVCLSIEPKQKYDFGDCSTSETVDILCKLKNDSSLLPATFSVVRPAHFKCRPDVGRLEPGQMSDLLLTFCPGQLGRLKGVFKVNVFSIRQPDRVVATITISVSGKCSPHSSVGQKRSKPRPLKQRMETMAVDVSVTDDTIAKFSSRVVTGELSKFPTHLYVSGGGDGERLARSGNVKTSGGDSVRFAGPGELACSIRPHDRREASVKVPFTKVARYTYVDPDYAFDDLEIEMRRQHRDKYVSYLRRNRRPGDDDEQHPPPEGINLGMKPATGLTPIEPSVTEIEALKKIDGSKYVPTGVEMATSRVLAASRDVAASHFIGHALHAAPLSAVEKAECRHRLSPEDLLQFQISPSVVEFGQVCCRSVNIFPLRVVNSLDRHAQLAATVDCSELRQSSFLEQVIPPRSTAEMLLVFESHRKGRFQRSIHYTINGHHQGHVLVQADVVDVALHLSAYRVILRPCYPSGMYQATITLENKRNHPAEFVWVESSVIDMDEPPVFVVEPPRGVVEPYRTLTCLVTYQASFEAALEGRVTLEVKNGNRAKLRCAVELGVTKCGFTDRRLMFGVVPFGLETTRSTWIENTGTSDAQFSVVNSTPYAGMAVHPTTGSVPAGGRREIKVSFEPRAVEKFDAWIKVRICGAKPISLRLGGAVESPSVDVNLDVFRFEDVYCGSLAKQPFRLINRSRVRAEVRFDLSSYHDFALRMPTRDVQLDGNYVDAESNVYLVNLLPGETAKCQLMFAPEQVAAYDFVIPVVVNNVEPPAPPCSPWPPSPTHSRQGFTDIEKAKRSDGNVRKKGCGDVEATPKRRVLATALKSALDVSGTRLEFDLKAGFLELSLGGPLFHPKGIELKNLTDEPISWYVDLSRGGPSIDEGIFNLADHRSRTPLGSPEVKYPDRIGRTLEPGAKYTIGAAFCPQTSGYYKASLPLHINKSNKPYRIIDLRGNLEAPSLTFDPSRLTVMPTPLGIPMSTEFKIEASGFHRRTEVTATLPDLSDVLEARDVANVALEFIDGRVIESCSDGRSRELRCRFTFVSNCPVSYSTCITFNTLHGHVYQLPVTMTADNCIFTIYPYMAAYRSRYQIVKEPDTSDGDEGGDGEPVLIALNEAESRQSRLSTVSSTSRIPTAAAAAVATAAASRSELECNSSLSGSLNVPSPRDGARNFPGGLAMEAAPFASGIFSAVNGSGENGEVVPGEDWSEEQWFLMEVVATARRWFSVHGWPGHPRPVDIPDGLRSALAAKGGGDGAVGAGSWKVASSKKLSSVLDCVSFLCGSAIPGIPINSLIPSDPVERAKYLHWLYSTLLAFLTSQGALLGSIEADTLLEFNDFRRWHLVNLRLSGKREARNKQVEEEENKRLRAQFDILSSQAWTDLLLQILKVFVLARVPARSVGGSERSIAPSSSLGSNIYGSAEKLLLTWLNRHYEENRKGLFAHLDESNQPPARWIVNFDLDLLDGLVIAACLAAYAPYLIESHLKGLYPRPSSSIERYHNAILVVEAIKTLELVYDIQPRDFLVPNPLFFVLFSAHLYEQLPGFVPKTRVHFDGVLSLSQERRVVLKNPARKPLVYNVKLVGSGAAHFRSPSGDKVQIQPGGQVNFAVQHTSKVLNEVEAVLLLTSHYESPTRGRTLAFRLSASVSNVQTLASFKCSTRLYKKCTVDVRVTNPFQQPADYSVILIEESAFLADVDVDEQTANGGDETGQLPNAFFTSTETLFMESGSSGSVTVVFLPLHLAQRRCYVLFSCPTVGEFICNIEAVVTLPLPSVLLSSSAPPPRVMRIGSAAAETIGRGETKICWRSAIGEEFSRDLLISAMNPIQEAAVIQLAQLQMSAKEVRRRRLTGTLNCASITRTMAALHVSSPSPSPSTRLPETVFQIQVNSDHFVTPVQIVVPLSADGTSFVPLSVGFTADTPGYYPCQVVLWSPHDVRVLRIECVVSQGASQAQFDFTTPALTSVIQNVPIVNSTPCDWELVAGLKDGDGFSGPPSVLVKAQSTARYPLQFRPLQEGESRSLLTLTNREDGCEYGRFELKGCGLAPNSLEKINIQCQTRKRTVHHFKVPNFTKQNLIFNVDSDLPFISGNSDVAVEAESTANYRLSFLPRRRGDFNGVIRFRASNGGNQTTSRTRPYENYQVWYDVRVAVDWPEPKGSIQLECAALEAVSASIPLTNSTDDLVAYTVSLDGPGLSGPPSFGIARNGTGSYEFVYEPKVAGRSKGVLVLEDATSLEEFWYELILVAEPPKVRRLTRMQAELGKSYVMPVQLNNPLKELLVLTCRCSNMKNFQINAKDGKVLIPAMASASIDIEFTPSSLGEQGHSADISFSSKQLGEWRFSVSGVGLVPQTSHAFAIHAPVGEAGSGLIRFRNPLAHNVVVDIRLKELAESTPSPEAAATAWQPESLFGLLMDKTSDILVGPESFLDIPVSFAPVVMALQEAEIVLSARRPNGDPWDHHWIRSATEAAEQTNGGGSAKATDDMKYFYWFFEVRGVPEMASFTPSQGPLFSCPARCRLESRVEVCLVRTPPKSEGYVAAIARPVTPANRQPLRKRTETPDSVLEFSSDDQQLEKFTYGIVERTTVAREAATEGSQATSSVGLTLVRRGIDGNTGVVSLLFGIVLAPSKPFKSVVLLEVCSEQSGIWRFPLRLHATELQADDVLTIEAVGLNQESRVGFRLDSQAQHPVPFKAFFSYPSDPEITIHPTSGELMPASTNGTLFQVSFTPTMYGKPHQSKLIIQTASTQWTYLIRGIQPSYIPPQDTKPLSPTHWDRQPINRRRGRRNFVLENLEVRQTGISSSFKGTPLLTFAVRK
eukprot:m.23689 g.23689  ORF g.23689 m.23689 type:complete len:3175 (+) comp28516_c0_seq2:43-9567(+)